MKQTGIFVHLLAVVAIALFSCEQAFAQLDPTFGTGGISQTNVYANDTPLESFLLPKDKILVVNNNSFNQPQGQYSLLRFNANGTPDTTYGTNGAAALNIPYIQAASGFISAIARQPDGKLIFVGNNNADGLVVRFNENGTLDTTFAAGGVHRPNIDQSADDVVTGAVVQADGKILIAGYTTTARKLFLLRYESNGLLDTSFGTNGFIVHDLPIPFTNVLRLYPNGKILVPTISTISQPGTIYRFNSNGSLDSSFTPISFNIERFKDLLTLKNDKILMSDSVSKADTLERFHSDVRITRFDANGTLDTGFGVAGSASVDVAGHFDEYGGTLDLLPDGQIVVSAITNITANRSSARGGYYSLLRFSPDGEPNGKFLVSGIGNFTTPRVLVSSDSKILGVTTKYLGGNGSDLLIARAAAVPLENYKFKANPFDFGSADSFVQHDAKADLSVYRASASNWYINPVGNPFYFGLVGDIPVPRDYIKDYGVELAIFRPNTGTWYIGRNFLNPGQSFFSIQWGLMGDIPVPFDHDGDSKADIAVFRPTDGNWYVRHSSDESVAIMRWGMNGDKPVAGDYDGDGREDIAVFRPSNGVWYIFRSSDNQPQIMSFGMDGDIPVPEDYDGDGKTDIGVWRPSTGVWYVRRSTDGGFNIMQWGLDGDIPVPADFDGDLKTDLSVWRPGTHFWYTHRSGSNTTEIQSYGLFGDIPVPGRY